MQVRVLSRSDYFLSSPSPPFLVPRFTLVYQPTNPLDHDLTFLKSHLKSQTVTPENGCQPTSRDRIVVSTLRCGRSNPGSNPGHGIVKQCHGRADCFALKGRRKERSRAMLTGQKEKECQREGKLRMAYLAKGSTHPPLHACSKRYQL